MRALKIAGGAVAAVIVVAALLLVIGIPSGFLTSAMQAAGRTRNRIPADDRGLHQGRPVAVAQRDADRRHAGEPENRDTSNRLTVGRIQADMTLASLWSGHPEITELAIVRPVLNVPLLRQRRAAPAPASSNPATAAHDTNSNAPAIERIKVSDATIVFSNLRDRVENRIDGINADATVDADRKIRITGNARASEHPLKFDIKATAPAPPLERQNIPVELTLDAPGLLQAPLSGRAEVRLNGSVVMINGLSGTMGDGAFNGWASVDLASKPLVKLDLDFQRLDIAAAKGPAASQARRIRKDSPRTRRLKHPSPGATPRSTSTA